MTLEEAREFFRSFNGSTFHMSREEPQKLSAFQSLGITEEVKDGWRMELAEEYLDEISSDNPKSWSLFSSMASVLMAVKTISSNQENMFIEGIEKQAGSDLLTRTITLETVCGRTYDYHDGVIAFFRKKGMDVNKLSEASEKLFSNDLQTDDERLKRAMARYRSLI